MPLPELCYSCKQLKDTSLGKFERIPGRFHDRRFRCDACRSRSSLAAPKKNFKSSPLERDAVTALIESGYVFVREYELAKFRFDFAIPSLRLLIEVDSKRWHSHPSRKKRDRVKSAVASKLGWFVSRVQLPDLEGKVAAALQRRADELNISQPVVSAQHL